jgi:hypothetical protein
MKITYRKKTALKRNQRQKNSIEISKKYAEENMYYDDRAKKKAKMAMKADRKAQ